MAELEEQYVGHFGCTLISDCGLENEPLLH